MDISVAIVAYNAETTLEPCLRSILCQRYTMGALELLVIDGRSSDSSRRIVRQLQESEPRLRLLDNPERHIAAGRNVAVREATHPYLLFTDADCVVPGDWLEALTSGLGRQLEVDPRTVAVGGGNLPHPGVGRFGAALGIYLDSLLGTFNSPQGRNFSSVRPVRSLACFNVLYRREVLEQIGGFDEQLASMGEDLDLNIRLNRAGHHLYYLPRLEVQHALRGSLRSWARNMWNYGRGRARVAFKHSDLVSPFVLLPLLFAVAMGAVLLSPLQPLLALPLLYFPVLAGYVLTLCLQRGRLELSPLVFALFASTHLAYAGGLTRETVRQLWRGLGRW